MCFFSAKDGINELKVEAGLKLVLPDYSLPKLIKLPCLPKLTNGKTDRQALLEKYENSKKSEFSFTSEEILIHVPAGDEATGRILLNSVARILGSDRKPSLEDNFFEIGGDSLNMVLLLANLSSDFGLHIGMTEFVLCQTLAGVVGGLSEEACSGSESEVLSEASLKKTMELLVKEGAYESEEMTAEHKDVVVDMISRSFADKGDLTTLAEVTYEHLFEQVTINDQKLKYLLVCSTSYVRGIM